MIGSPAIQRRPSSPEYFSCNPASSAGTTISASPNTRLSVLQVVGGPEDGWSVKCFLEFARLCPNTERRTLPCGQGDQSIVDRRVGCRSIGQQRDVAGKRARCHVDGIPVLDALDLTWLKLVSSRCGLDGVDDGSCVVVERGAGVQDVVAGLDRDAAVVA